MGAKVSFARGDVGAFEIGTDISGNVNEVSSRTIAEMGKTKKCQNYLENSYASYVFVVMSIILNEKKTKDNSEKKEKREKRNKRKYEKFSSIF